MSHLLGPLTLRCDARGRWWALNRREGGWAEFGYSFDFLGEALDRFEAQLVSFGTDRHGLFLTAVPKEAPCRSNG